MSAQDFIATKNMMIIICNLVDAKTPFIAVSPSPVRSPVARSFERFPCFPINNDEVSK